MYLYEKALGNKSTSDKYFITLLESPAIMAFGISRKILTENPIDLCDRSKLLSQQEQAGKNYNTINEESIAIVDCLLEYKSISTKQHKLCLLLEGLT